MVSLNKENKYFFQTFIDLTAAGKKYLPIFLAAPV